MYQIWDVFTRQRLGGNPLAVVPDAEGLTDEQMQALAGEFNLSETSFVFPSNKADISARYFTPTQELPMAGHPSIGTVYALHKLGRVNTAELMLELKAGIVPMRLDIEKAELNQVWMAQGEPRLLTECQERSKVAKALGLSIDDLVDTLPIQIVSAGVPFMLVPVDSLEGLAKVTLDLSLLPEGLPNEHRAVLAFTLDAPFSDVRCRMLGEAVGVREDPATGAAHGPLGWYLAMHELFEFYQGQMDFVSHQGVEMGRKSEVNVSVTKHEREDSKAFNLSVQVGGSASLLAEGTLYL